LTKQEFIPDLRKLDRDVESEFQPGSAMSYLFRIEKRGDTEDQLLGYDWIEVLAIEPWALGRRSAEYGDWCDRTVSVMYICLTEAGLIRIGSADFWTAVEEFREYAGDTAVSGQAEILIQNGDRSVVQIGSTTVGDIHTGDHTQLLEMFPQAILVPELRQLRAALRGRGPADEADADTDAAIGALAEAELAAERGDDASVVKSLKRVGKAGLSMARDIGVEVAAAAITKASALS
jgi:hypothetical protein